MKIVNVRGTSGSGKSTLARAVMARYPRKARVMANGRKQPIGYILAGALEAGVPGVELPQLYVPGHYETACGGCDTITSMDDIYDHVTRAAASGMDVFFEGLLLSSEHNRTLALAERFGRENLLVVGIDIPLQECLDSVNGRRRAKRGPDAPGVNPKNTESKWKATRSVIEKLQRSDVRCEWQDRDGALRRVLEELGHAQG